MMPIVMCSMRLCSRNRPCRNRKSCLCHAEPLLRSPYHFRTRHSLHKVEGYAHSLKGMFAKTAGVLMMAADGSRTFIEPLPLIQTAGDEQPEVAVDDACNDLLNLGCIAGNVCRREDELSFLSIKERYRTCKQRVKRVFAPSEKT